MARREMGGYWSTEENGKFQPCGRSKGSEKVSKVRPTCKSHTDDKLAKGSAVEQAASNTGPKPTNVATFAKRKKMSMGGLV